MTCEDNAFAREDSLVIDLESDNVVIEVKSYQEAQLKITRKFKANPKISATKIAKVLTGKYLTASGKSHYWDPSKVRVELDRLNLRKIKHRKPIIPNRTKFNAVNNSGELVYIEKEN